MHHMKRRAIEALQLMGVMQPIERIGEDPHVKRQRHVVAPHAVQDPIERLPLEIVHGDEILIAVLTHLVRVHHVRMVELGRQPGLIQEHGQELGLAGELFAQLLDHHQLVETGGPLIHAQHDARHASLPQLRNDAILTDLGWQLFAHVPAGPGTMAK